MSDTVPGPQASAGKTGPAEAGAVRRDPAAMILDGLGERREGPRIEVQLPCAVYIGSHVHDGALRDVSAGGGMVHGVRGMLAGDTVRLRLARIAGVGVLGLMLELRAADRGAEWRQALLGMTDGGFRAV